MAAMGALLVLVLVVAMEAKECGTGEECMGQDTCPSFLTMKEEWKALPRGSDRYKEALNGLKERICDTKKVCCPCPSTRCVSIRDCPNIQDDFQNFKGSDPCLKEEATERIKSLICDKRRKAICCPLAKPASASVCVSVSVRSGGPDSSEPSYLPGPGSCGVLPDAKFAVGGEDTQPGEHPWAALLGTTKRTRSKINGKTVREVKIRWGCGGVLINRWFVLTAAHCQGTGAGRITHVRLGEWHVAGYGKVEAQGAGELPKEQEFQVAADAVILHPDYRTFRDKQGQNNLESDIALVRLPGPVKLNQGVQLVCLPVDQGEWREALGVDDVREALVGKVATVVGWGFTTGYDPWAGEKQQDNTEYGVSSRKQQKLNVPILSDEQCDWRLPNITQVCAGGEEGKSSCRGDSGGGLYYREEGQGRDSSPWYLLGIVSLGSIYCGDGTPGLYTRVEPFIPWITETTGS